MFSLAIKRSNSWSRSDQGVKTNLGRSNFFISIAGVSTAGIAVATPCPLIYMYLNMMGGYTLGEGSSFWMPLFEMSFLMTTVSAKIGRKLSQVGVQNILNGKGGVPYIPRYSTRVPNMEVIEFPWYRERLSYLLAKLYLCIKYLNSCILLPQENLLLFAFWSEALVGEKVIQTPIVTEPVIFWNLHGSTSYINCAQFTFASSDSNSWGRVRFWIPAIISLEPQIKPGCV